jgi:glycosyltransferase involved in cell wall biosynthesis
MRIGFVTADWSKTFTDAEGNAVVGGAGWYRCQIVADALAKNGHEVFMCPTVGVDPKSSELIAVTSDNEPHFDCDIIVLQRWMDSRATELVRRARKIGQIIINDVDDWFGGLDSNNGAFIQTHPRYGKLNRQQARRMGIKHVQQTTNKNDYLKCIGASSLVTVSTPFLAEKFSKMGVKTELLRNAIDIDRWTRKDHYSDKPFVGWVGGTTHRSGDLEVLRGIISDFLLSNKLTFVHSGHMNLANSVVDLMSLNSDIPLLTNSACSILDYPELFNTIDIGLAPLRDISFNRAKSWIKVLEYSASGIPFVASKLAEYKEFGLGYLATSKSEWCSALKRLLDPSLRNELSFALRSRAEKEDISLRWSDWESVYKSLLES